MVNRLSVSLGRLKLANPVIVASGTFGYGREYQQLLPLEKLGALVTKTITLNARRGNPPPRIVEARQGMLNAIGLENPGIEAFIQDELPFLQGLNIPVIVSIAADQPQQFAQLAQRLAQTEAIAALELNLSCPNLRKKTLIAQDAQATYATVKAVRKTSAAVIITKLSPNVTDITQIAQAAEDAGSDVLALVNTFFALSVDLDSQKAKLGNISGGLSGPAIKPQALWMVWQVFNKVKIPIIGMGGIMNAADALEFILCGASAIAVGTANFVHPRTSIDIIEGINRYLLEHKIPSIQHLRGAFKGEP